MDNIPPFFPAEYHSIIGHLAGRCIVCNLAACFTQEFTKELPAPGIVFKVICSRCGVYRCTHELTMHSAWRKLSTTGRANISGYIRENQNLGIFTDSDLDFLQNIPTPTVAQKAQKLLASLARFHPIPGTEIQLRYRSIDPQMSVWLAKDSGTFPPDEAADKAAVSMFPLLSFAWAQSESELTFLIEDYLIDGVSHLTVPSGKKNNSPLGCKITAEGWRQLQQNGLADNSTGFVAMWFDPNMETAWEKCLYPAIHQAGYTPLRIDKHQHNNKIDDEILASIRGARFVVSDFTGGRGGVYFEAGFASGLGKPVIWTVREDCLKDLHFDTRQYNHICWKPSALDEFKKNLQMRIEATIGKHRPR